MLAQSSHVSLKNLILSSPPLQATGDLRAFSTALCRMAWMHAAGGPGWPTARMHFFMVWAREDLAKTTTNNDAQEVLCYTAESMLSLVHVVFAIMLSHSKID